MITSFELVRLGQSKESQEDFEGALEAYTQAILIDPENTDAFYHKSLLLQKKGKLDEAINILEKSSGFLEEPSLLELILDLLVKRCVQAVREKKL
jgi:tetratricopeptide (TPR) repeat protein